MVALFSYSAPFKVNICVIVIDNHRVLHGRSAFDGQRRMCGAYIGVDEYRSKLAVLTERFRQHEGRRDTVTNPWRERDVWAPFL